MIVQARQQADRTYPFLARLLLIDSGRIASINIDSDSGSASSDALSMTAASLALAGHSPPIASAIARSASSCPLTWCLRRRPYGAYVVLRISTATLRAYLAVWKCRPSAAGDYFGGS
jgi:hypothetical protein